jgi:hypothetical protein
VIGRWLESSHGLLLMLQPINLPHLFDKSAFHENNKKRVELFTNDETNSRSNVQTT